jgi:pyruvate/2-oxoglutarate dehydrogenase complex dihydrolipoamide dehydrogenase (E3) component
VPKKVLVSTVELAWRAGRGRSLGVTGASGIGLDWAAITARKNRLIAEWSKGEPENLQEKGIAVVRGPAAFTGPHAVRAGARTLNAERVVIATGSSPARPSMPGVEHAITNEELLALTTRPDRMVVIGGGAIGMEFGFAFARAGTRVTVLQAGPAVLPAADDEVRAALEKIAREAGLDIRTQAKVTRITPDRVVEAEVGGTAQRFPGDAVLIATGRPPNIGGLGLDAAGVAVERGAVKVNEFNQSPTAAHVYAAGDVTGLHQHTPAAWYDGRLAAENAVKGNHRKVDYSIFPTTMFTIPALAQVGLTEAEARRRGSKVAVKRVPYEDSTMAGIRDETDGLIKVVSDEATGRLLGVHILGAHAEELIHIAAVAMRAGLTRKDLAGMHYVFPTLAGSLFDAMWD